MTLPAFRLDTVARHRIELAPLPNIYGTMPSFDEDRSRFAAVAAQWRIALGGRS